MNLGPELVLGSPSGRSILFQRPDGPKKKDRRTLSFNQVTEKKPFQKKEQKPVTSEVNDGASSKKAITFIDRPNPVIYSKRKVINASLSRSDLMEENNREFTMKNRIQSLKKSKLVRNPREAEDKISEKISSSYDGLYLLLLYSYFFFCYI